MFPVGLLKIKDPVNGEKEETKIGRLLNNFTHQTDEM